MPKTLLSRTALCCALSGFALVAAPAMAAGATPPIIPVTADQQTALGVRLTPVQAATAAQIELPARVTVPPSRQAIVSAPAPGMLTRLLVNPGDVVRKGQPLAELSSPQVAQLQRERSEAQSQLDLANRQFQRDELLVGEGIAPTSRLDASRAQQREARAMLAERDLALRLTAGGTALNGLAVLRAPMDGAVTEVAAVSGQRVEPAAPLFRIAQPGELWLEIDASPQQAAALQPGETVEVADRQARGTLRTRSTALGAGQSVALRVQLTQPGSLIAGEVVRARVQLPAQAGMWRLPLAAVTRIGDHDAVFVAADGGFRAVQVEVASRLNDAVLVTGPLAATDKVAAAGVVAIKAITGEVAP